ncbi:MAG: acyl-CoA thioesterase domain-containing protein [Mycetocola sp.]
MPVLNEIGPIEATRDGGSVVRVAFDPRWCVRSVFGGAVAAMAVRAGRAALDVDLSLSEGMFSFVAPLPAGPAAIEVRPTRAGRRFAGAEVNVVADGVITMRGTLAFAAGVMPTTRADAAPAPTSGAPTFDGEIEWCPAESRSGEFTSWVRATGAAADLPPDEWACIAVDLLGPAVVPEIEGRFAVATAFLSVTPFAAAPPGSWARQSVTGRHVDGVVAGTLDLRDAAGGLLARATQRSVVTPTASDDPRLVTAFANSSIHSQLFGMN